MRAIVCSGRSWFSLVAFLVALSFTLVACDSGGGNGGGNGDESFPEPPGRPGFTSTVTGAWQASLSGAAAHMADGGTAGRVVIRLSSDEASESVITLAAEGPIRSGMYAVQPAGSSGVTAHIQGPAHEDAWKGASGELQITRVDGSSIVGRFRVVAHGPHGESLTASGTFETAAVQ